MKVGVLGSGDVARALAGGFLKHGHPVTMGTRDASKLAEWARTNPGAAIGGFADAARFGEIVILAVNGAAASEVLRAVGSGNLSGKTVIDVTNPIADAPPDNGIIRYFTNLDESLMERLQRECPGAHFVKAFNQSNHSRMVNPQFAEGRPTMFICGNSEAAKEAVAGILDQFGWEAEDMGLVEAARAIEPLCMLWVARLLRRNKVDHAFKLLRQP
jgi:8-hydroxy-5-deazaflavin:NADPH oxidoreductase